MSDEFPVDPSRFWGSRFLGLEVTAMEDGYSRATVDVTDELRNMYDVVHGGVLYTMADTTMGAALQPGLEDGEFCATIEIKTSYIKPVVDGTVVCETATIFRGGTIAFLESTIENDGETVARASGTYVIMDN